MDNEDELDELEDHESIKDRVRRGPLLGALLVATLVAGAIWVVLKTMVAIRFAGGFGDFFASETGGELWVWAQTASEITYSVFLVALGSYVVLWLGLREDSS